MNCYLSRNYKGTSSAGNKAKTDMEQIMQDMGYRNVGLKQTTYNNKVLSFLLTLASVLKAPFCLHRGDCLVLQYPLKKYFTFVCRMAHLRGAKVVALIHDLGTFRRKALTAPQEIKRLNHADYLIALNGKMKQWLEENGCKAAIGTLDLWDYLSESEAKDGLEAAKPYSILYAGALNPRKNTFLYEMGDYMHTLTLNLYGGGFRMDKVKSKEHYRYMGFVQSDELIATAQGDFGLVWDGFSLDGCTGDFGEYLQYNNPHKTSLYIRCGLPVIIWEKAALADFIRRHNIGICIGSLKELEGILDTLSSEAYMEMKRNIALIGQKVSEGYYFRTALTRATTCLSS